MLVLASVAIVLLPMSQTLRPGLWPHQPDWDSAMWAIAYAGRFFAVHGALPVGLDSERFAGNMSPVFYAPVLFPPLGLAATAVGVAAVARAAAAAVWALQYLLVARVTFLVVGSPWRAVAVAAMTCWTIYPLNNLYHRGAFAEFLATALLTSAVAAGGMALLERRRAIRVAALVSCGWCGAAAAGGHGITAIVGGAMIACLVPAALRINLPPAARAARWRSRRRVRITAGLAAAVVLVMSPWLYASLRFAGRLEVAGKTGRLVYTPGFDNALVRLSPLPVDLPGELWPHNHTQLNAPLLFLLAWTLAAGRRRGGEGDGGSPGVRLPGVRLTRAGRAASWSPLLRMALILLGLTLVVSVVPFVTNRLPRAVAFIQYAYRFITYNNLAILVGLLAALAIYAPATEPPPGRFRRADAAVWTTALVLSSAGASVKLWYAGQTLVPATASQTWHAEPDALTRAPKRYHAHKDYVAPDDSRLLAELPPDQRRSIRTARLPVGTGQQFGLVQPFTVEATVETWVQTNVVSFPWNRVLLDDQPAPPDQVRETSNQLAVLVPPGTHTIGYRPEPDRAWVWLRRASLIAFGLWTTAVPVVWAVGWAGATRRGRGRSRRRAAATNAARLRVREIGQ